MIESEATDRVRLNTDGSHGHHDVPSHARELRLHARRALRPKLIVRHIGPESNRQSRRIDSNRAGDVETGVETVAEVADGHGCPGRDADPNRLENGRHLPAHSERGRKHYKRHHCCRCNSEFSHVVSFLVPATLHQTPLNLLTPSLP